MTFEEFQERCKQPVDIATARQALRKLFDGDYSLSVPVNINDPDVIISRVINKLEAYREGEIVNVSTY